MISGIVYFREIILESSRTVSETTPGLYVLTPIVRSKGQSNNDTENDYTDTFLKKYISSHIFCWMFMIQFLDCYAPPDWYGEVVDGSNKLGNKIITIGHCY